MIVVGVDAAIRRSGWAIVQGNTVFLTGAIQPAAKLDRAGRCWELYEQLRRGPMKEARARAAGGVCVVIERPGGWARSKERSTQVAVEALAMARASAMIAAVDHHQSVVELEVNETRTLVLGSSRPSIRGTDVKDWVRSTLGIAIGYDYDDPDVADAVVVALAGYRLWKAGDKRFPVFKTG